MTFPTIASVLATCTQHKISSFSFDVFDTFLFRRCANPDGVFDRAYDFVPWDQMNFVRHEGHRALYRTRRRGAENRIRTELIKDRQDREVTIDEIYTYFPLAPFGIPERRRRDLVEAELRAEKDLCFANPQALALYQALREQGIQTGFISDIYWSGEQLADLLRHCAPSLEWDFLYASADFGKSKAGGLLRQSLRDRRVKPERCGHIGDNPAADIAPARGLGMIPFYCPQMSPAMASVFQREDHIHQTLCSHLGSVTRLDQGLRSLRRRVVNPLADAADADSAGILGALVLGPVMEAFDRFALARFKTISAATHDGPRRVGVACLARDGLFPFEIWNGKYQAGHDDRPQATYISINRRIGLVAGSTDYGPLQSLFHAVPAMRYDNVEGLLKTSVPKIARYFAKQPGGITSGSTFARALPSLLSPKELADITLATRDRLMTYLRCILPDLDHLTDLVMLDVGYSGTVQKALQTVLTQAGLRIRLHGCYLITAEEAFHDLAEGDSAVGLVGDHSMDPHGNAALRCNVAVLEQICSEPNGSVQDYQSDGRILREPDPRPQAQHELCAAIRQGAYRFIDAYREIVAAGWPDPFADVERIQPAVTSILARLLLFPTDNEITLLSDIKLDVNLGSQAMIPLIDTALTSTQVHSMPLLAAFRGHSSTMWPAASLAALSPSYGYLYTQFAAEALTGDVFGDPKAADLPVIMVKDGTPTLIKAPCFATSLGTLRVQIPLPTAQASLAVLLPLADLPPFGIIRGIAVQKGINTRSALRDSTPQKIPLSTLSAEGVVLADPLYQREQPEAHLLIPLGLPKADSVHILTITIAPLTTSRPMALVAERTQ